ncbi:hypothetical protein COCON_G00009870 [Conger conger]|uniref:Zinc finger-containing ubiquitin peptidase 1 n=2 Tax=Conger conger TaxID=82655 RepID=A0A9Q1I921_CONCO|nr:zinc finger-containing ubiquitin peptidase 1 isoform X2 [Conger conger]XP_061089997.1 zinc finger-containing ubiquitin peptidase 1 isoform X2 [Conger conger]XP_061090004.1 zinc finger-containing ubiquitin peptidase 1 isoform X2 [Conger conger]KAJ8288328.1 hypothetical protein COCON_G00009870 [Conger conger]
MFTCEICGEDVPSESEMRSHLLLGHLEAQVRCPLCSLAGVSYDELQLHINTAHAEEGLQQQPKCTNTGTCQTGAGPHLRCSLASNKGTRGVPSCNGAPNTDSSNRVASVGISDGSSNEGCSNRVSSGGTSNVSSNAASSNKVANGNISDKVTDSPRAECLSHQNKACMNGHSCTPQGESMHTHNSEADQEPVKTKHKRLSSPRKDKLLPCPLCSSVFSDCFILQEHVELHLQDKNVMEGDLAQGFKCPMCSLTCSDGSALQLHVELHLEAGTESSHSDMQLARRLQQEEDARRKAEEDKREAAEFKKLQKQFGLDSRGGYRRQIERNMEKAVSRGQMAPAEFHRKRVEVMESLASGVDNGKTRTSGLIAALYECYQREGSDIAHVWLSSETDHYCSSDGDQGWGCGYRNFQMLLSSLHKIEVYKGCFTDGTVPSIPRVQALIEEAWCKGVDPQGASHFDRKLQGSSAWIGATEIYSLFTSFGVRARIVDFHQPTGPGNTHPQLFEWVKRYFSVSASRGTRLPPRVVQTTQPPIYLQHQGHSRSIVGVEQRKNGSLCLLIFDPGCSAGNMRKLLARDITGASLRHLRKHPGSLKHNQYQIVTVEGVLSPEERRTRIVNSRSLRADRIP